jgi:cytochrome c5
MLMHLKTLFWQFGLTAASLLFLPVPCNWQENAGRGAGLSARPPGMASVAMSATRPSLHSGLRPVESASQQSAVSETVPQSAMGAGTQGAGDQRFIDTGRGLFQKRCVQCHDAEKSLQKSRTAAEWRSTVARMARQDGAEIPRSEWEPISVYLAAVHGHSATSTGATGFDEGTGSEITMFGTISPTFRSHSPALPVPMSANQFLHFGGQCFW